MPDLFGIMNFVALCVLVSTFYYFRDYFINQTSEESIAHSVISAISALATMEELAEQREAITAGLQPFFAEAMTGVIEQFEAMMAKTLPSEADIKQITDQFTQGAPKAQAKQPGAEQLVQQVLTNNEQLTENPLMQLISTYFLKQFSGEPTKAPSGTSTQGGW